LKKSREESQTFVLRNESYWSYFWIYIYIYKAPKTEEEEKVHRIHSKRYVSKQIPRVRWGLQLGLSLWLCLSGKEKEQFL